MYFPLQLVLVLKPPLDVPFPVSSGGCTSFDTPTWPGVQPLLAPGRVGVELASVVGVVGFVVVVWDRWDQLALGNIHDRS